jgi:hypothetical protein
MLFSGPKRNRGTGDISPEVSALLAQNNLGKIRKALDGVNQGMHGIGAPNFAPGSCTPLKPK